MGIGNDTLSRRLALGIAIAAACHSASSKAALRDALEDFKPTLELRMRMESVDQQPLAEESEVTTLRARLGLETGKVLQTTFLVEGEGVVPVAGDYRPDNAVASHLSHPVVADPEGYEINRLQLTNTSLPGTVLTLGRQRITLDDQRFIGNSGWRQNEQTFDALRIVNKSIPKLTFDVSYFDQVNRIFGPESPQGRYQGSNFLGNVAWQLPIGKLSAFGYLLDFDPMARIPGLSAAQFNAVDPLRMSSATYGLRLVGERPLNQALKLSYAASYAQQSDYQRNPLQFSLDYRSLEVGASWRQFNVGIGQELMQGNGVIGFNTPLGTLHKFQGWADKFLATPVNGMDDRYVNFGYQAKQVAMFDTVSVGLGYHVYASDRVSTDLGDEVNVQLQARWQRFSFLVKYASYSADAATPAIYRDTDKYWAQVEFAW